jgi:hypothetical protein
MNGSRSGWTRHVEVRQAPWTDVRGIRGIAIAHIYWASVLHYCGFTVPEAAARLGHDASLHLKTYAHVIEAIRGQRYADLDALIAAARASVPSGFRKRASA